MQQAHAGSRNMLGYWMLVSEFFGVKTIRSCPSDRAYP